MEHKQLNEVYDSVINWAKTLPKKKNAFSWPALILVTTAEALAWWAVRTWQWQLWGELAVICSLLVVFLWLAGTVQGFSFWPKSHILTKLLTNAIAPRWIGVFYLLSFAVHIGWLADTIMYLYVDINLYKVLISIVICLTGLTVVVLFFPDGRKPKSNDPVTVFISGMSNVSLPKDNNYSLLNLRPLVRMLQHTPDGDVAQCEMLILLSKINPDIKPVLALLGDTTDISKMSTLSQLELLIKLTAKREFPNKKWIDSMQVTFTTQCDYNDFSQCYNTLVKYITKLDDRNHRLILNLSPGTVVISSLMTLMAIDGDRELYYYSQDNSLPDERRMQQVDKKQIPLYNLLSQALEKMD